MTRLLLILLLSSVCLAQTHTEMTLEDNQTATGNKTLSGSTTVKSLNSILYASQYTGADICVKVNAAIAALPTTADGSPSGKIIIDPGTYSFSTTCALPATHGHDSVLLEGTCGGGGGAGTGYPGISQGGTVLNYTGSGIAIQQLGSASNQNDLVAGLRCLVIDGTNAGNGAVGVEFGGVQGFTMDTIYVTNFSGTGSIGVRIHNSAASQFTERTRILGVSFNNNTTGLQWKKEAAANNSFSHSFIDAWFQINSGQVGMAVVGGAQFGNMYFNVNGNCSGSGPFISLDSASSIQNSFMDFNLENNGTCQKFNSAGGGGFVQLAGLFENVGSWAADTGTITLASLPTNGTTAYFATETAAQTGIAGFDLLWADSTTHTWRQNNNNGTTTSVSGTLASGTAVMTTAGITTGACGTTVTVAATGVATTDTINFARNAAATIANGGGLTLNAWPTSGNVNFNYCNSAAGTITPTAMTINWSVVR